MSRLGKTPITLPKNVEVKSGADGNVSIKGPKGLLELKLPVGLTLKTMGDEILVECDQAKLKKQAFFGLFWSLIRNNVIGVSEGYQIKLKLIGVGYRANIQGQKLDLQLGFSHPTWIEIPKEVQVEVEKGTTVTIKGIDKRIVGQFAAEVRAMRPPEPYKGKGVRYVGEYVRKKAGKTAKGK